MEDDVWNVPAEGELGRASVLYCSFPSLKDPAHDPGPHQRHTGEIVTFVPWETFAPWKDERWRKRGPSYEALKERLTEKLLSQFFEHRPALGFGLVPMHRAAQGEARRAIGHHRRLVGDRHQRGAELAALMGIGVLLFVFTIIINVVARGIVDRSARRKRGA